MSDQQETFSRDYVVKLRDEAAKYRQRAGKADEYAQRLHQMLVERTGLLADPTDLPFDPDHLDDEDTLTAAIDQLVKAKPHLKARVVSGDIGQGASVPADSVNLASILRANAL